MKKNKINRCFLIFLLSIFFFTSCEDYLEKTPEAEVTEREIFGDYESFQGFIDIMYAHVMNFIGSFYGNHLNFGGDHTATPSSDHFVHMVHASNIFGGTTQIHGIPRGIWKGGWNMIRIANTALENLDYFEGTEEERRILEGQAYFFRAYYHGEIIAVFGGMPYIDEALDPEEDMRFERLSYHESVDRVIEDLDKAIALLPEDWDKTGPGGLRAGANHGRATRGAALGYKQRWLLYAASPLMNGASGNTYTYNVDYAEKSAAAGWDMIQLANKGLYELVPWENYSDNFYKMDATTVWTTETIWARSANHASGYGLWLNVIREQFQPFNLSDNQQCRGANQTFVDFFEMADGTRYKIEYDQDDDKRWENRDPRFHFNHYVDRERVGDHPNSVVKLWVGQEADARPANNAPTAVLIAKYWPYNLNIFDQDWTRLRTITPKMRLAEVYINYAEAVTVAYGPNGSAPGADLTAVDAINIVRARAGMPPVTSAATGYDSFMDLVRNERKVELAYEEQLWFDLRRWYIAHELQLWNIIDVEFDKDWTYFNRRVRTTQEFEMKHYWWPIYPEQVQLYPGFYQNPGW